MKHIIKKSAPVIFKGYILWSLIADAILLGGVVYLIFR